MTKLEERLRKYTLNPFVKVEIVGFERADKDSEAGLANADSVVHVEQQEGSAESV